MIKTRLRIHDKFAVECKIGFVPSRRNDDIQHFKMNTWIFVPNGIDINKHTYKKEQFYSDIKSNVRIITPIYSLSAILEEGHGPFPRLEAAIDNLFSDQTAENKEHYLFQMKMFLCIFQSTLRDDALSLYSQFKDPCFKNLLIDSIHKIETIAARYRSLRDRIEAHPAIDDESKGYFRFGDEYMSNVIEENAYSLMQRFKRRDDYEAIKSLILPLLRHEQEMKLTMGYALPSAKDKEHNSLVLIKRSLLRKLVESDLYLQRIKRTDGLFAREFYYGLAAGLAMIFATIVTFIATPRYGNFTIPLFFILVVSYIFKDRIKDTARQYFSSKLDKKYFDWKWLVSLRNRKIGWIKEAFDFISEESVPEAVMQQRNKSALVKAENKVYDEKVILYRKRVELSRKHLEEYKAYHLVGINNIIRLNLTSFTKKMDNPQQPLFLMDETDGYTSIAGNRVYALYFVLDCQSDDDQYYKTYRVLLNRNGISDITEIDPS